MGPHEAKGVVAGNVAERTAKDNDEEGAAADDEAEGAAADNGSECAAIEDDTQGAATDEELGEVEVRGSGFTGGLKLTRDLGLGLGAVVASRSEAGGAS